MLAEPKLKSLTEFISTLNKEELIWVNGYLSGLVAVPDHTAHPVAENTHAHAHKKITIAYGLRQGIRKNWPLNLQARPKKMQCR
jgi:sulfite reductase (NADPH) flavoprotein alpha-component